MIPPTLIIRDETPADVDAIFALTTSAFAGMPFSDGSEPHIINRLRADGDLTFSLVAEISQDNQKSAIVGQITFSPVEINGVTNWYGLGPVSVAPNWQRGQKGTNIGSTLIEAGLSRLKDIGVNGCVLVGNPDYYSRFGFKCGGISYGELDPKFVQWLSFRGDVPIGKIRYSRAFGG